MIYANENDVKAASWLSCLPLPFDWIDSRSIVDVKGSDIDGYSQCHFFAGIGGWPLALQSAGWPDDAPVWTGSCPCQPFSVAGKRKGLEDERHLWPEFRRLIAECKPPTLFGEQVASKAGREWLSVVRTDLEALGYAVGAADLCAAGSSTQAEGWFVYPDGTQRVERYAVGAPHIRQRLFWVAHMHSNGRDQAGFGVSASGNDGLVGNGVVSGLADAASSSGPQQQRESREGSRRKPGPQDAAECGGSGNSGMVHATDGRSTVEEQMSRAGGPSDSRWLGDTGCSPWADVEYIPCRDGKARPVKPGVRCLAHGIPGRVAQLRGLGNAIVPALAAEFVMAFMETFDDG